jgi:hypothetical protein
MGASHSAPRQGWSSTRRMAGAFLRKKQHSNEARRAALCPLLQPLEYRIRGGNYQGPTLRSAHRAARAQGEPGHHHVTGTCGLWIPIVLPVTFSSLPGSVLRMPRGTRPRRPRDGAQCVQFVGERPQERRRNARLSTPSAVVRCEIVKRRPHHNQSSVSAGPG